VGVGNRIANAAIDDVALQKPNATLLYDSDDWDSFQREMDELARQLPPADDIIIDRLGLELVDRIFDELDRWIS
jgi:hypothetical protein